MTAKEFVKQKYPAARAERHTNGRIRGLYDVYWLIRNGRETMYMAFGKTESNAWVKAKEKMIADEKSSVAYQSEAIKRCNENLI